MIFNNLFSKRRSIIITWFMSYISVLIIPVVISVAVYTKTSGVLEKEITRANSYMLRQVKKDIESRLEEVERLNTEISWNPNVQDLVTKLNDNNETNQYDIVKVVNTLKMYQNTYSFIDDFYVYHLKSNFVLCPATHRDSKILYEQLHESKEMTYEKWVELIERKHSGEFVLMSKVGDLQKGRDFLAYMNSIPPGGISPSDATVVILLNLNRLLESFENLQWFADGQVTIINKDQSILAQKYLSNEVIPVDFTVLKDGDGVAFSNINGKKYAQIYISSPKYGWKYVSTIPYSVFWQKAEYVRNLVIISILLSILGGGVLTYYFSRKNYSPIDELVRYLTHNVRIDYKKEYNELNFIREAISQTVNEQEKSSHLLKQQNRALKANYLVKLLRGTLRKDLLIEESNTTFEIDFPTDCFAVVLFYHENIGEMLSNKEEDDEEKRVELAKFIVTNVVEEIASQKSVGYAVEVDNMVACLISFKEDCLEDTKQEVLRITENTFAFLKEKFNINLSASISSTHSTVAGISNAYNEAVETLEYMIVLGDNGVVFYEDIPKELYGVTDSIYYYPLMLEQQLMNSIKVGDVERAKEILNNIFEENFEKSAVPVQIAKCLMFDMVGTMIKTINEISDSGERQFFEDFNPIAKLIGCQSVKEMKNTMWDILEEVSEFSKAKRKAVNVQKKEMLNRDFIDEVAKYIENNYDDGNLNVTTIGKEFNTAPPYLSKMFKDYMGESMLDYINKCKIRKAKELLRDYRYTIYDVAKNVGFVDSNTFIRAFKKYEGITPGKYKEFEQ